MTTKMYTMCTEVSTNIRTVIIVRSPGDHHCGVMWVSCLYVRRIRGSDSVMNMSVYDFFTQSRVVVHRFQLILRSSTMKSLPFRQIAHKSLFIFIGDFPMIHWISVYSRWFLWRRHLLHIRTGDAVSLHRTWSHTKPLSAPKLHTYT